MTQITTLIPAYNKAWLGELFAGLCNQRFQDFRVILSDDSPDGEITTMIRDGRFDALLGRLDLVVLRGPRNARLNHQALLDAWGGKTPLVHFHLDDDLIFPDFYQAHVDAHARHRVAATISRRWLSGSDGRPAASVPLPEFAAADERRVVEFGAEELFATTVARCDNWLGELTHMVFSADGARHYPQPSAHGLNYYGLLDIGFLLEASRHMRLACLREHLGVFRQHAQQTTHNRHTHGARIAFLCWVAYALAAWREGRLPAAQVVQAVTVASQRTLQQMGDDPVVLEYLTLVEQHNSSLDALCTAFTDFWLRLLASQPATRPAPQPVAA
jgi:hypothetical protein